MMNLNGLSSLFHRVLSCREGENHDSSSKIGGKRARDVKKSTRIVRSASNCALKTCLQPFAHSWRASE